MKPMELVNQFRTEGTDVFLYNGPIERKGYDDLCDLLSKQTKKGSKVLLFLTTLGGDPNAGYRVARALIHNYGADNFRVAITGYCKSAGTLICIGAHSLVFFDAGELGPLDIQFQKQDEIFKQSSGLDILRGMTYLRKEALETFNDYLLEINGGRGLSTKVASEIASKLVMGVFQPIFGQIDPVQLGEMNAALQIAYEYGTRLNEKAKNLKDQSLSKLINNYPTHGFVIDRAEARGLFQRVEPPKEHERECGLRWVQILTGRTNRTTAQVMDVLEFLEAVFGKEGKDDAGNTPGDDGNGPPVDGDGNPQGPGGGQGPEPAQVPPGQ